MRGLRTMRSTVMEIFYTLCLAYVALMWFMFILDNLIFLILRLLKKEPGEKSKYAFSNAFMQRGKDTEVFMAIINIVAYVGFFMWLAQKFSTAVNG